MTMTPTRDRPTDRRTLSQLMDGEWHDIDRSACVAALCAEPELKRAWERWHLVRDAMRGEPVAPAPASLAARIGAAVAEEPTYSNVTSLPGAGGARAAPAPKAPAAPGDAPVDISAAAAASPRRLAFGGLALAASVALATVVGLEAWRGGAPDGPDGATRVAAAGDAGARARADDPVAAALGVEDGFGRRPPPFAPLPEVDLVANTDAAGSYWVVGDSGTRRGASERRLNAFLTQHLEHSPTAAAQGMLPYSRLVGYDELPSGTVGGR